MTESSYKLIATLLLAFAGATSASSPSGDCAPTGDEQLTGFRHLGVEDGLTQQAALSLHQDRFGNVWIGTENGLNRFDGHEVHQYLRDPNNPDSIPADLISSIDSDPNGNLWLAARDGGFVHWERNSDSFEKVVLTPAKKDDVVTPQKGSATEVAALADGGAWLGVVNMPQAGLIKVDKQLNVVRVLSTESSPSLPSDGIVAIEKEKGSDAIWVATTRGLGRLSSDTNTFDSHPIVVNGTALDNLILNIHVESASSIWIATFDAGVVRLNPETGKTTAFQNEPSNPCSLPRGRMFAVAPAHDGQMWVGTEHGLAKLNPSDGIVSLSAKDPSRPSSLAWNTVLSLLTDASGLLWVGTHSAGVDRWNPRSLSLGATTPAVLRPEFINAITTTADGTLWVGSMQQGLTSIDNGSGPRRDIPPPAIPKAPVMTLVADDNNDRLWIGTYNSGLHIYSLEDGSSRAFVQQPTQPQAISSSGVMSIIVNDDDTAWVGTFQGGLNRMNIPAGTFEHITDPNAGPSPRSRVSALAKEPNGTLWVGTLGEGLGRLDGKTGEYLSFQHDPARAGSLGANTVFSLHIEGDHTLWIGTSGSGLSRLPLRGITSAFAEFENLTTRSGLSGNTVYGILPDNSGNLWLSSNNGLMRFNPKTRKIKQYQRSGGLVAEEFNFGAYHRDQDGRLYFGATGGINAFIPEQVAFNRTPPPITMTAFEKFGKPADTATPVYALDKIELSHRDNVMTLEYAALDYTAPELNMYSHKLEGFDRAWSPPSHRRRTTYTNLDAGNYVFRVRAANNDGVWNNDGLRVELRVAPAPWQTIWAYMLYGLIATLLLMAILRWRTRAAERRTLLNQYAYYDKTTGLPNLVLFSKRAENAMRLATLRRNEIAILCVHLTKLDRVNDTLGFEAVDTVVRTQAGRVVQLLRADGRAIDQQDAGSLTADSFVLYIRAAHADSDAANLARRIAAACSREIEHDDQPTQSGVSIGMSLYPDHGTDLKALIQYASTAANEQRLSGTDQVLRYTQNMTQRAVERIDLERDLRLALQDQSLELYYQPKFDTKRKLVGAEALCRWTHPTRGPVSPAKFVPLAEDAGLMTTLNAWVVQEAYRQVREWLDQGLPVVPIAFNLSADEFLSGRVIELVSEQHARHAVDPSLMEIELTESALVRDVPRVKATMAKLKALGHGLALDDFGTGYSSLRYLQRFPISKLKIDQSFVDGVEHDAEQQALCSAIIAMARSLGIKTIAEGVESQTQLDMMTTLGCDHVQGFLFSPAVPSEQFVEIMQGAKTTEQ